MAHRIPHDPVLPERAAGQERSLTAYDQRRGTSNAAIWCPIGSLTAKDINKLVDSVLNYGDQTVGPGSALGAAVRCGGFARAGIASSESLPRQIIRKKIDELVQYRAVPDRATCRRLPAP